MRPLYTVSDNKTDRANQISVEIALNAEHEIFKAHFPGDPIFPGVYMIRIVKDAMKNFTGENLYLAKARNIKFLAKINPHEYPEIRMDISLQKTPQNDFHVTAQTRWGEVVFFKFSGVFSRELKAK